jgi:two-component system sensor histidine kinase GlrK
MRRQREKMEQMLRMTTHELKTPIAGMRALLQSLELGSIPETMRPRMIAQGLRECTRLEHLTETMLAHQRFIIKDQTDLRPASISTLISAVVAHRQASHLDQHLHVNMGEEMYDVQVLVDRDAFQVILENLLDNVAKYGGGKSATLTVDRSLQMCRVHVADQGIGFHPRIAEQLFEPFRRSDASQVVMHGTGLGLSIARNLAHKMGGDLVARSDGDGLGATFTLTLVESSNRH